MDSKKDIQVDFFHDWTQLLREELRRLGYNIDPSESDDGVCEKYFNVVWRLVRMQPRTVHVAREFKCPPKHQAAIDVICNKVISGADLNPYLSRYLPRADYNDLLLNDWDIYHFHLGLSFDRSDRLLLRGTKHLLFARVTDRDFYAIDVRDHRSFEQQDLLEIVHDNWPGAIQQYRIGAGTVEVSITEPSERKQLRRAGVSALV